MRFNPLLKFGSIGVMSAMVLFSSGCNRSILPSEAQREIRGADLIPVSYPQSALSVGALGWGNARGNPESIRAREQNLSDELLASLTTSNVAFMGEYREYQQAAELAYAPGPAVVNEIAGVGGEVDTGLAREGMRFLDWGELVEETIDFNRLSEAVVRGWYNFPGEQVKFSALSAIRPDLTRRDATNRPWIVRRAIASDGMKYEVSSALAASLQAKAAQPLYGEARAGGSFRVESGNNLVINRPMVIAFDTAELYDVVPPLPTNVTSLGAAALETEHVFTWRMRESRQRREVRVVPSHLRRIAQENSVEVDFSPQVVESFTSTLQQAQPARLSVIAEAKAIGNPNARWVTLTEGDSFYGDELVRVRMMLQDDAYVYILAKDSRGQAAVLYPQVAGENLSRGSDSLRRAGQFVFPTDLGDTREEGLIYDPREAEGIESFIIVATTTRTPQIATEMAKFAQEARTRARGRADANTTTVDAFGSGSDAGSRFSLSGLTRLPVGYSSTPSAGPGAESMEVPVFAGVGSATVITLNLRRKPVN